MFFFLFWSISIKTQYKTEMEWKKNPAIFHKLKQFFRLKFLSRTITKFWANKISVLCIILVDIL